MGPHYYLYAILVDTAAVKTATFSADERLIEAARAKARSAHRTLNDEFRAWLQDYVGRDEQADRATSFLDHLTKYAATGGRRFREMR